MGGLWSEFDQKMQLSSFLLHIKKKAKNYFIHFKNQKMPKRLRIFFAKGYKKFGA